VNTALGSRVGVAAVTALTFGGAIYTYYRVVNTLRTAPGDAAEELGERLVAALNEVEEDPVEFLQEEHEYAYGVGTRVRPGAMLRCAVATALLIRSEYNAPTRTEANRLVVEAMATKLLRIRNVRRSDIARMLPMVVLAVFTPSADDILFRQVAGAAAVVTAVERGERRYKSGNFSVWLRRWWHDVPAALEFAK